jgi:long-chain fatty acid transport protein
MKAPPNLWLRAVCGTVGGVLLTLAAMPAKAGYGAYQMAYGGQSGGLGGVAYAVPQDTTPLSANPALAMSLGTRWDLGMDWETVDPTTSIHGNLLGRNERYPSRKRDFPVPRFGFSRPMDEAWAVGMTGFFAGFGADYPKSPLERFGGDPRVTLALAQAGISTALAYALAPRQHLGLSLNLSYQELSLKGAGSFARLSDSPDHFTNQGRDGSLGVGFTLGWNGALTPWASAGLGYRSKTWAQRFKDYAGLLPQQGLLELPAVYGGGLAVTPVPEVTLVLEVQRVLYEDQKATGNPLSQFLREGQRFGSDDGPGFGWNDQTIYRIGLAWHATSRLLLRGGYSYGTQQIPASETLFASFGPSCGQRHASTGFTYGWGAGWELTGALSKQFRNQVHGENSIPLLAGGGEVDLELRNYSISFAIGRRY